MRLLMLSAALLALPTLALAGNTTSSGVAAIASSVGSVAGTPVGSCVPTTILGVSVPGCNR